MRGKYTLISSVSDRFFIFCSEMRSCSKLRKPAFSDGATLITERRKRSAFAPICHFPSLRSETEPFLAIRTWPKRIMEPTFPPPNPKSPPEDIFDSSLNLEQTHLEEGFRDGFNDGLIAGKGEGKDVGLKVGFEIGEELGFYHGIIDVFLSAIQFDSDDKFSSRVIKIVGQMDELIQKYPILEPEKESGTEIIESLRLKFRVLSARLLPKRLEYDGYPKSSSGASGIEF